MTCSLRKQQTFRDASTGFPARETSAEIPQPRFQGPLLLVPAEREVEREPGNEVENSILMTPYYPDLGSAFDWFPR